MSDHRDIRVVAVRQYAVTLMIDNDVPESDVDQFRPVALDRWNRAVAREGYQSVDPEPTARLDRSMFPMTYPDSDVEMPNRAWTVVGRVLPDDVPLPQGGIDPMSVVYPEVPS